MRDADKDYQYIRRLLPEIDQIKSGDLRKKVATVWVKTWRASTWKKLKDVQLNPEIQQHTLIEHHRALTQIAIETARVFKEIHGFDINMDYLIAGSLLHDVSKLLESEKKGNKVGKSDIGKQFTHGFFGAHFALDIGIPTEIAHLVATHTSKSNMPPQTIEGVILRYLDPLDVDAIRSRTGLKLMIE